MHSYRFGIEEEYLGGYPTGLSGYRIAANDALPRTGFPEMFRDLAEYETYLKTWSVPGSCRTQPMCGGRCGSRCNIRHWSCG